ncbi:MAG: pantetheine-phosphate adenylyltransferase [Phycisphaerae bacterium]|nr:pantetheine-phosphate adenylyltransferase [Phycisphaerae bacterium]
MPNRRPRIAVFAGTFDPPTKGHLGIIDRARRLFDRTIVAVGVNPEKSPLFTAAERVEMLRELLNDATDVEVESYTGLTMDYVKNKGADVIVKGIRDTDDLRNELRQANVNMIAGDVETVFLFTDDQTALISGTLIRQIAEMGGLESNRIERLIPASVVGRLRRKLNIAQPND